MSSGIAYGWLMAVWDGAGVGIRWGHWQDGHALMGTWNMFFAKASSSFQIQCLLVSVLHQREPHRSIRKTNSCACVLPHCSCLAECLSDCGLVALWACCLLVVLMCACVGSWHVAIVACALVSHALLCFLHVNCAL